MEPAFLPILDVKLVKKADFARLADHGVEIGDLLQSEGMGGLTVHQVFILNLLVITVDQTFQEGRFILVKQLDLFEKFDDGEFSEDSAVDIDCVVWSPTPHRQNGFTPTVASFFADSQALLDGEKVFDNPVFDRVALLHAE